MEKLYKLDSKNKLRVWEIGVLDKGTFSEIVITAGLKDGKPVKNTLVISQGKNIGKSNETTHYTQALAEAQAKWELQVRSGYVTDESQVKQATLSSGLPNPMLAQKYDPTGKQKGSKTLAKMKLEGKPIAVQPKFDGNRCLIKLSPDYVQLYTRKGDLMLSIPHIEQALREAYDRTGWRTEVILDGELFTDAFSFNTLNGLLRKEEKSEIQKTQLQQVDYRLYDIMSPVGYIERHKGLKLFLGGPVKETETVWIIATDENIRTELERFLGQGHEGLMLRDATTPYENKRSWSLVKCKLFEDEEFELEGMEEDARGGFVGAFIMRLPVPVKDRDGKVLTVFRAGVTGLSQEEGRAMWENRLGYIGKQATVEFFGRSEYGVPRFPKLKAFRD